MSRWNNISWNHLVAICFQPFRYDMTTFAFSLTGYRNFSGVAAVWVGYPEVNFGNCWNGAFYKPDTFPVSQPAQQHQINKGLLQTIISVEISTFFSFYLISCNYFCPMACFSRTAVRRSSRSNPRRRSSFTLDETSTLTRK